jgi:hypothetical protein
MRAGAASSLLRRVEIELAAPLGDRMPRWS